jgi:type II secretory pathway pseudopilin PulG
MHTMRNQRGITLIEMLVGLSMLVIVVPVITFFLWGSFKVSTYISGWSVNQQTARRVISQIVEEIREIHVSDANDYPLAVCTTNELVFYADNDGAEGYERIRYSLEGIDIIKGVIEPVSNAGVITYPLANEYETTLVTNVRNVAEGVELFSFYNQDYIGSSGGVLTGTVHCPEVRMIGVRLMVDTQVEVLPDAFEISTEIMLRNLKSNL